MVELGMLGVSEEAWTIRTLQLADNKHFEAKLGM